MLNDNELLLLKNQACFPAYAVANKILRRYQPLLKELDLTYTQYITMMVLWEKGEVNEKDLVETLYLKANTLTEMLKNMHKKALITIRRDEKDRRNIIISLTEKGKDLKTKAVNVPKTLQAENWLSEEEFITLRTLLYKLLEGDWGE